MTSPPTPYGCSIIPGYLVDKVAARFPHMAAVGSNSARDPRAARAFALNATRLSCGLTGREITGLQDILAGRAYGYSIQWFKD